MNNKDFDVEETLNALESKLWERYEILQKLQANRQDEYIKTKQHLQTLDLQLSETQMLIAQNAIERDLLSGAIQAVVVKKYGAPV